jgi:hypothetical protein
MVVPQTMKLTIFGLLVPFLVVLISCYGAMRAAPKSLAWRPAALGAMRFTSIFLGLLFGSVILLGLAVRAAREERASVERLEACMAHGVEAESLLSQCRSSERGKGQVLAPLLVQDNRATY